MVFFRLLLPAIFICFFSPIVCGQQATVRVPFRATNDSFFEQHGTSWSLSGPNWFAQFGGGAAMPAFGGAGIAGGAGFAGGGVTGRLGFMAAQGSRRSNVSQSGNLTLFNGYPGALSDTSQSPFVISLIPVVGQGKAPWRQQWEGDIPMQRPDESSAYKESRIETTPPERTTDDAGLLSLAEIQRQRAAAESSRKPEVLEYLNKAREARRTGKANVARIYYRMAAQRAEGAMKNRIAAELAALDTR